MKENLQEGKLGTAVAITVKATLVPMALTAATAMGAVALVKKNKRVSDEFARTFSKMMLTQSADKYTKKGAKYVAFMDNYTVKIPMIGPDTINPKLRTQLAQTQQARIVGNLSAFLNDHFSDRTYMSKPEIQLELKKVLLSEEKMQRLGIEDLEFVSESAQRNPSPPNGKPSAMRDFKDTVPLTPREKLEQSRKNLENIKKNRIKIQQEIEAEKLAKMQPIDNVKASADAPPMLDPKKVFGKAAYETDLSFVTLHFVNEHGKDSEIKIPVRVAYIPVPESEMVTTLVRGVAFISPWSRFKSMLGGYLSASNYLFGKDVKTMEAKLTRIAGISWINIPRKAKVNSSIVLTQEQVDVMKEQYGMNIYNKKHLLKMIQYSGLFDIFIIDETDETISICNYQSDLDFTTYPLAQIYRTNKQSLEGSTILIQQG